MSCQQTREELVSYHFGTIDAQVRPAVEQHLLACAACLAEFVALKRAIETAENEAPASPVARERLRQAVGRELGIPGGREAMRPRRAHWERPLAFGFAAMAVACALFIVHAGAASAGRMPRALQGSTAAQTR